MIVGCLKNVSDVDRNLSSFAMIIPAEHVGRNNHGSVQHDNARDLLWGELSNAPTSFSELHKSSGNFSIDAAYVPLPPTSRTSTGFSQPEAKPSWVLGIAIPNTVFNVDVGDLKSTQLMSYASYTASAIEADINIAEDSLSAAATAIEYSEC